MWFNGTAEAHGAMLATWFSANGLSWRTDLIEAGGSDASNPPPSCKNWWNAAMSRARSRPTFLGLGQGRTAMVYNNFAFRNWQNEFPDLLQYAGLGLVPAGPQGTDWTSRAMWRRRFPRACPGRGRRSHWASGPRT